MADHKRPCKRCDGYVASYDGDEKFCSDCRRKRKETRDLLTTLGLVWFFGAFLLGALNTCLVRGENGTGCIYKSIASFTSPGYILGCELFRKRFEVGK